LHPETRSATVAVKMNEKTICLMVLFMLIRCCVL
jgi:hypothetical protein